MFDDPITSGTDFEEDKQFCALHNPANYSNVCEKSSKLTGLVADLELLALEVVANGREYLKLPALELRRGTPRDRTTG